MRGADQAPAPRLEQQVGVMREELDGARDVMAHRRPQPRAAAGGLMLVPYLDGRVELDAPARRPQADAEVDVFEVEGVARVEAADAVERRPAHDEEGADDPRHVAGGGGASDGAVGAARDATRHELRR